MLGLHLGAGSDFNYRQLAVQRGVPLCVEWWFGVGKWFLT
jgi:hypothetical protein